jgi:hypothetical protein
MAEVLRPITDNKSALLLDVDGVFLMNKPSEGLEPVDAADVHTTYYNPLHGDWLRKINQKITPYYLSARMYSAHEDLGNLLSIPEFDWINHMSYWLASRSHTQPVKRTDPIDTIKWERGLRLDAVKHYLPTQNIVWIDDLLSTPEKEWADKRNAEGHNTLLIRPDDKIGLEEKHITEITQWIGALAT